MRRNLQSIVAFSMRATIQARDQQSIHYEHCAFLFLNRLADLDRPPKLKKACLGLGWRRSLFRVSRLGRPAHTFAAKPPLSNEFRRLNSISCRVVDSISVPAEYNDGRRPPYLLQTEACGVTDRYNPSSEL
ncbi:hypothetical protein CcaCcLH18_12216 [Colletotrichum camelliae]|nr:hypothetical protein CcaCcLH18_12216 [Colletotrichum camelliae]